MRTLSEVNRDISKCEALLNVAKTTEEALLLRINKVIINGFMFYH